MRIFISSYFKKHFKTYIDYLDHYWIQYFEKRNIFFNLFQILSQIQKNLINDIKKVI